MIKYRLLCGGGHEFEGWFRDSADYDRQAGDRLVECPVCGDNAVRKAVMAPAVSRRPSSPRRPDAQRDLVEAAKRARAYVEKNFDYVGGRFPEEARRIHYGETEPRRIYGEASGAEVKELAEEGVCVAPLPGGRAGDERAGDERAGGGPLPSGVSKKLN